jgi:hypothetical protein
MYILVDPVDGEVPATFVAVAEDHEPTDREFLVEDVPSGYVWDATSQTLKKPSAATRLEKSKRIKREQLRGIARAQALDALLEAIPDLPNEPAFQALKDIRGNLDAAVEEVDRSKKVEGVLDVELGEG